MMTVHAAAVTVATRRSARTRSVRTSRASDRTPTGRWSATTSSGHRGWNVYVRAPGSDPRARPVKINKGVVRTRSSGPSRHTCSRIGETGIQRAGSFADDRSPSDSTRPVCRARHRHHWSPTAGPSGRANGRAVMTTHHHRPSVRTERCFPAAPAFVPVDSTTVIVVYIAPFAQRSCDVRDLASWRSVPETSIRGGVSWCWRPFRRTFFRETCIINRKLLGPFRATAFPLRPYQQQANMVNTLLQGVPLIVRGSFCANIKFRRSNCIRVTSEMYVSTTISIDKLYRTRGSNYFIAP